MYPTSTVEGTYYANFRPPIIPQINRPSPSKANVQQPVDDKYRIVESGAEPITPTKRTSDPFTINDLITNSLDETTPDHLANYVAAPSRGCRCTGARPASLASSSSSPSVSPRLVYNPVTKQLSTDVNRPFSMK